MYAADEMLKELYQTDTVNKTFIAEFRRPGESEAFLVISDRTQFIDAAMEESLTSDQNLEFGSCEATELDLTLTGITEDVKGCELVLKQVIGEYVMPFGKFMIQSSKRQPNTSFWDIKALDFMTKFDVNVIDWYKSLDFPLSLKDFRASLCEHVGVTEEVPDYLPNEDMTVELTVDTAELLGRDVLIACEQANGVFGHFDRNGILQHITLSTDDSFFPSLELYPSEELYPVEGGGTCDERITRNLLISCQFEEYSVKSIDKVQIRQEEGDIGAIYGEGTNAYTVEGNFLMFGKTADELAVIAEKIYGMVTGRVYIPFESDLKGLPYIEVGDTVKFTFDKYEEDYVVSYVTKRRLKGIYALRDTYSATGDEIRSAQNNVNSEIIQLKGKAAILKKNVDEVSVYMTDLENDMISQFAVTAAQIESTVQRINDAESSIKQNADNISLMVKKGEVSAQISIESGGISITGNRFSWTATNSSLTADGTLTCTNGVFSGKVTAGSGKIGGFTISGNKLVSSSSNAQIEFDNFYVDDDGLFFAGTEINEDGIAIGSIGNRYTHMWETDTGDLYVNELYIDQPWWEGWSVTETVQELWEYVHGGGWNPCGSDCDDDCSCDAESCTCNSCDGGECSCESESLIDDINGCGCGCDSEEGGCSCNSETYCPCDSDCSSYNEGPGC